MNRTTPTSSPLRIAVVGAGPVGLTLALLAARVLPAATVSLYDARPLERDVCGDARTLALALGSVQLLRRLHAWPAAQAEPILQVHVSQAPPTLAAGQVQITAAEQGVPMLGAVIPYGPLVAALQQAWLAAAQAEPARLLSRFGTAVARVRPLDEGVEVDAGSVETFELVVLAEGGVYGEQARKALVRDYRQTAWVGEVELDAPAGSGLRGVAFERFTRQGPLALLPLPPSPSSPSSPQGRLRAALVWCVSADDDPVRALDDEQRRVLVQSLLPAEAGLLRRLGALKSFPLGLNAERSLVERGGSGRGAGRIVRIGNAAQTLHPVAGQGLNLGLRDAYALVHALRSAPDVATALRRVEWARVPDRWSTIATTDLLARGFTWRWPALGLARGAALAALQAVPPLKAALARQMMFGRR